MERIHFIVRIRFHRPKSVYVTTLWICGVAPYTPSNVTNQNLNPPPPFPLPSVDLLAIYISEVLDRYKRSSAWPFCPLISFFFCDWKSLNFPWVVVIVGSHSPIFHLLLYVTISNLSLSLSGFLIWKGSCGGYSYLAFPESCQHISFRKIKNWTGQIRFHKTQPKTKRN